ncbi:MAG: hypothetical protein HY270_02435, partial [Deltaproteobacteria bacterium]|nr:hypothetical protein [Deltaproteobacteria bacterium]
NEIIAAVNNALNGCVSLATPTATATQAAGSYVGDYHGTSSDGAIGVRFRVVASGSATGFLDFLGAGAAARWGQGGGADILFSTAASGQANLSTGQYELSGSNAGSPFSITGQMPASGVAGTFDVGIFGTTYAGTLIGGLPPTPGPTRTPTPAPSCGSANLQMSFSNLSGNFNGDGSSFVVGLSSLASEGRAPDYIAGFHETYNSSFIGTACAQARNIQVDIFGVVGGLVAGQAFSLIQSPDGAQAIVYYGQEASGGDSVWSSSAGTVYIDSIQGSVLTMRVVGAAMTETAGSATGSFTLDVSGQVNNFTHEP